MEHCPSAKLSARRVFLAVISLLLQPIAGGAYYSWDFVAPGLVHIHEMTPEPWDIHVLMIDLDNSNLRLRSVVKNDNMRGDPGEVVSSMARRHKAIAAVNTDFFNMGNDRHEPQGWTMTDGKPQLVPYLTGPIIEGRPALVIPKKGAPRIGFHYRPRPNWHNVASGFPRLIVDGVIVLGPSEVYHPRTAVGITQDSRRLILLTVDGRQSCSRGTSHFETAILLWKYGAWNAMNLDGGGSTTMWVDGEVVNHPSDGRERRVCGALAVLRGR